MPCSRCYHCLTDFKYYVYDDKYQRASHSGELSIVFDEMNNDLKPKIRLNDCSVCYEDFCIYCNKIIDQHILFNDNFNDNEILSRYEEIMEEHKNCSKIDNGDWGGYEDFCGECILLSDDEKESKSEIIGEKGREEANKINNNNRKNNNNYINTYVIFLYK